MGILKINQINGEHHNMQLFKVASQLGRIKQFSLGSVYEVYQVLFFSFICHFQVLMSLSLTMIATIILSNMRIIYKSTKELSVKKE